MVFLVNWNADELKIIESAQKKDYKTVLREIPDEQRKYKCYTCYSFFSHSDIIDGKCPECGEVAIHQACPLDTVVTCHHDISTSIANCPVCGQSICPQCGKNHSVVAISRVTGYLSATSGWNKAKLAELHDRQRYNPLLSPQTS